MSDQKHLVVVTGGARSGKSTYAERLAAESAGSRRRVVYIATSEANDAEMRRRVDAHRDQRPQSWQTVECPLGVAAAARGAAAAGDDPVFLLDCVTLWVSNLLLADGGLGGTDPGDEPNYDAGLLAPDVERAAGERVAAAIDDLLEVVVDGGVTLIAVTNEVGLGVVPEYPWARLYRDQLGWANRRLAAVADKVYLLVSGLPLDLGALAVRASPTDSKEPQ